MHRLFALGAVALVFSFAARAEAGFTHAPRLGTHSALSAHQLWQVTLAANADSAPAYLPHVRLGNGKTRAIVFALAGNNGSNCNPGNPLRRATLYAYDAATGKLYWSRSTSGASRCTTAGPVARGAWVYAPGLDGRLHRYVAATGKEITTGGWPERITLMPDVEKMSDTPRIHGHYLYVTTSGFIGDQGHYEGHLVTINLRNGHANVFNSLCSSIRTLLGPHPGAANYCSAVQSGLFGHGQAVMDPISHDVYVVSGNGPWNGHTNWGDTIMKLDPSGARLVDAFTPTNQADLNNSDQDLGSTGPAILPPIKEGGHTYHLLIQGGKGPACGSCNGAALRLVNRDNLSGQGGPGHLGGDLADTQSPGGDEVLTAPAVWKGKGGPLTIYADGSGVAAYRVTYHGGKWGLQRAWSVSRGGTTPALGNGAVWVASSGVLDAYRPSDGTLLWHTSIGDIHWEHPLVTHGRVFQTDNNGHLTAYAIS